jgi:hypothetical protein
MKKLLIILAFVLCNLVTFCQVSDSVKTSMDTIPKVAAPATAPAAVAAAPAEKKQGRSFREKFAVGFGTGFWITPNTTYLEIAPSLAYRFPKILTTGLGFRYIYRHDRNVNNDLHSYGPNVFARANLTKRVYFWTEYEYLWSQYFDYKYGTDDYTRETAEGDSWFVGLGYQRSVGKKGRGGISVQFLYNVLYDKDDQYNPYYSAFTYRVGYFF